MKALPSTVPKPAGKAEKTPDRLTPKKNKPAGYAARRVYSLWCKLMKYHKLEFNGNILDPCDLGLIYDYA